MKAGFTHSYVSGARKGEPRTRAELQTRRCVPKLVTQRQYEWVLMLGTAVEREVVEDC